MVAVTTDVCVCSLCRCHEGVCVLWTLTCGLLWDISADHSHKLALCIAMGQGARGSMK